MRAPAALTRHLAKTTSPQPAAIQTQGTSMTAKPGLSPAQLADLAKYDTPTVCNVVELFDLRPRNTGYMNDTIKACFPKMPPMVGYALTSFFRSMAPPRGVDVYASLTKQLEAVCRAAGAAGDRVSGSRYSGRLGHIRRGDVHDLQGVWCQRPDYLRDRPRSRPGRADQLPDVHVRRLALTVIPTSWESACRWWSAGSRFTRATCCTAT